MNKKWWKEAVIYQIYPRSFYDSNGDGIGDLRGIIQKIDYISDLGVDMIWLNPIYKSPNDDNGYDISDYYEVHPEYGSLDDLRELIDLLHARNMKILMDVVINHSSDEHPWFMESRKGEENPYTDFYIWRQGKGGGPPNNWPSFFGGSAWEFVPERNAYYLHLFSKKQPDLNWENETVRREFEKILQFWLEFGIDGFRMDVIPLLSKKLDFADADLSDFGKVIEEVYSNGPRIHEFIRHLNEVVLSKYDIMTVGEGPGINKDLANLYVGEDRHELDMIFQLDHMAIDHGPGGRFDRKKFDLLTFKKILSEWDAAIGERGWLSVFLDNHDFPRMVSRFGNDEIFRGESAKMLGMLILTMRGTPCLYFGSEIGMTNVKFARIEDYQDVETRNFSKIMKEKGVSDDRFLDLVETQGRDNARTPMQWSSIANGGFTVGIPWIKTNPNYQQINVELDQSREDGIFNFYRALLSFRKQHPVLVYGKYQLLWGDHPAIFAYKRKDADEEILVLLNFSNDDTAIPELHHNLEILMSNYAKTNAQRYLRPWEGVIYRIIN